MNCEPCSLEGREVEATAEYRMATVPPPRGVIHVCNDHAARMAKWAGRVEMCLEVLGGRMRREGDA